MVCSMDMVVNKVIGQCLRHLREQSGLTQNQVACRLRVTQSEISKVESGERSLRFCDIFPYAGALDIKPEKLYLFVRNILLGDKDLAQRLQHVMEDERTVPSSMPKQTHKGNRRDGPSHKASRE